MPELNPEIMASDGGSDKSVALASRDLELKRWGRLVDQHTDTLRSMVAAAREGHKDGPWSDVGQGQGHLWPDSTPREVQGLSEVVGAGDNKVLSKVVLAVATLIGEIRSAVQAAEKR